ncbi:hypothetical protein [Shewanella sp. FJAT-52076]|uniref:hypothetical protein n=1 Tax=Shewanella sp. FJAT-52076 TaxID=2864202 RepID=UPI001C65AC68|nr:hypothetical protein [Shewanella sp. FJAT-52076]QYJ74476.1 hypothetical protein K0H79_14070 [Shewanella sp. FJAT-52076]
MTQKILTLALGALLMSGCGWFGGDEKAAMEQAWLARNAELQQAIEQIRAEGLDAVVMSAEAGSVAACVANKLADDPLGELVKVEGALVESARVAELLANVQSMMEQEFDLQNAAALLQQGADVAAYAKTLIEQEGLEGASQTLARMASEAQAFAGQDLGQHFKTLIGSCETAAGT